MLQSVLPFQPKYCLRHPENYLFLLSKNIFTGSKYSKNKLYNFEKHFTDYNMRYIFIVSQCSWRNKNVSQRLWRWSVFEVSTTVQSELDEHTTTVQSESGKHTEFGKAGWCVNVLEYEIMRNLFQV